MAPAEAEDDLRGEWHGWGGPADERHFAFLAERGYAVTEFELRKREEGRDATRRDEDLEGEGFE